MAKPTPLTDDEIQRRLPEIEGWCIDEGKLFKEYKFKDFIEAFGFMTRAAIIAQAMDHHPEWFNVYNKVRIHLTTHSAGGISEHDFELAQRLNKLAR
jgi:4a-hydroxytetrahydrobiopterin dehydratase